MECTLVGGGGLLRIVYRMLESASVLDGYLAGGTGLSHPFEYNFHEEKIRSASPTA